MKAIPNHDAIDCPGCGSVRTRLVGHIPASDQFAGRALDSPLPGGALRDCRECELMFRAPRLPKAQLDELYREGASEAWSNTPFAARPDWRLAADALRRHQPHAGAVLDVGCFDGAFLLGLDSTVARSGIEIHAGAAARAAAAGVTVLGADFTALASVPGRFDAAMAFDVIEHVDNPRELLRAMLEAVRPGGIVVISTGNSRAWSWRLMGARYWYCMIPEHLCFICPEWLARESRSLGAQVVQVSQFSHDAASRVRALRELLVNLVYRIAPAGIALARRAGGRRGRIALHPQLADAPPRWITAQDHFLAVVRRGRATA